MRLFIFMTAVLVTGLSTDSPDRRLETVTLYTIPAGIPDGAILSFYFLHKGNENADDKVAINFYDLPSIPADEVYDITAHLRIDRNGGNHPVESNSYIVSDNKWKRPENPEMPQDETPPRDGWWRVDIVQIRIKYPNSNIPPMPDAETYTYLNDDAKPDRESFSSFPVGTHMEMTAVLRASGGMKEVT
ncbi:hypothetical protein PMAYCL1PPCAC_09223, partial [Pristionchus mayeri]